MFQIERCVDERYEKQAILPCVGVAGQHRLEQCRVAIVGMGGLGCPCAQTLAAGGVGTLGLVDGDTVARSNLHRQFLYREQQIGLYKADCAAEALQRQNSAVVCNRHRVVVDETNAQQVLQEYDVVVDATDNIETRYVLNDACIQAGKPMVSAAAQGVEGQIAVYDSTRGPYYRCIQPEPSLDALSCDDTGVLSALTGMFGNALALETIKTVLGHHSLAGKMLLYNGLSLFVKLVSLRPRNAACPSCGPDKQRVKPMSGCRAPEPADFFETANRLTWKQYADLLSTERPHVLVDVRERDEYSAVRVKNTLNIPLSMLTRHIETLRKLGTDKQIYLLCRRGVRSRKAAQLLSQNGIYAQDIVGGLAACQEQNMQSKG